MSGYVKTITKRQARRFRLRHCRRLNLGSSLRTMLNLSPSNHSCFNVGLFVLFDLYPKVKYEHHTEIEIRFIDKEDNAEIIVKEPKIADNGSIDRRVHCNLTYYQLRDLISNLYTEEELVVNKLKSVNEEGCVYRLRVNKRFNIFSFDSMIGSYENVD